LELADIEPLIGLGLKGIELANRVDYHKTAEQRQEIISFAEVNGLLITLGSDYHGKIKPHIKYGDFADEVDHEECLSAVIRPIIVEA
jgi:3',5'-nucleoside bisphosphate phosphatase